MSTLNRLWPCWVVLALMVAATTTIHPVLAEDSEPYNVEIQQVDAHDFPLVTLFVSITDPVSGEIINGLAQNQFEVTEDGKPVEIVEFSAGNLGPISTVLTIDRSGSMDVEGKMAGAKDAAHAFVDLMRPQDKAAIVVFNDTVTVWQDFTADQLLLGQRIDAVTPGGCTAWYDGVWQTVDLMARVEGRRNAILLSDGIDCREGGLLQNLLGGSGSQHSLGDAVGHAKEAEVAVHTIGLGDQATSEVSEKGFDEEKLSRMAADTGGTYHRSPTADQLRALYESFAENTQKEYVIKVQSGRTSYDGTKRDLKVTVGESSGSGGYVERHLLNVQSNPGIALAFIVPLLLILLAPLTWRKFHQPAGQSSAPAPLPGWNASQQANQWSWQPPYSVDRPPSHSSQPSNSPMPVSPQPLSYGPVQAATAGITCPRCRQAVRAEARFCTKCGAPQPTGLAVAPSPGQPAPPAAICSHCNTPMRQNARFCSACGQRSSQ